VNWITIIWSMTAAASLVLAIVHLLVWTERRSRGADLAFALVGFGVAALSATELAIATARTPQQYIAGVRWLHAPALVVVVSLVWFVRAYLHAGRRWLAWTACGLRAISLIINFLCPLNLNFLQISSLHQTVILGQAVTYGVGEPNPWMLVGQLSLLLWMIFMIDATVTVWRRGERRRALIVGGGAVVFSAHGLVVAVLVAWQLIPTPFLSSVGYLVLLSAMAYELSRGMLRASQLAEDLHESDARASLAADAAGLGYWTWDVANDQIWASERARSLIGFPPAQPFNLQRFLLQVHPDDRQAVQDAIARLAANGTGYEVEYRIALPDGCTRWLASRGNVERNDQGRPTVMRGVSMDITARKRAAEREREVGQLREELSHISRVTTMGQLASALAHEINQPLGAMLRNAEAAELLLKRDSPDLEELRAIIADIQKDDQRAGDVIDRLRRLLKRQDVKLSPLSVGPLLDDVAALVRSHASARHVQLTVESAPHMPEVMGDRVQLQQVLLNLVLNAIDAVSGQPPERRVVAVRAQRECDHGVEVTVRDKGHGVPTDRLSRIFEPFFTTKPEGLGMGLPISCTIIEAHGGRISARNNPDAGATFQFTLRPSDEKAAP
jgi:PAS domain S-box-containing protein